MKEQQTAVSYTLEYASNLYIFETKDTKVGDGLEN